MFQSLLCWIMVCKILQKPIKGAGSRGFNPCYVGLWSVRPSSLRGLTTIESFNPCYVGLWSVRFCNQGNDFPLRSFNPCYVGLWSVSVSHISRCSSCGGFQSLLCWIMVCKDITRKLDPSEVRVFQSLLCWIMVCKPRWIAPALPANRFNPCYVGLWSVSQSQCVPLCP